MTVTRKEKLISCTSLCRENIVILCFLFENDLTTFHVFNATLPNSQNRECDAVYQRENKRTTCSVDFGPFGTNFTPEPPQHLCSHTGIDAQLVIKPLVPIDP